ncbi:MAG: single-stranded DNA-binding protein [Bifidobacterium bifidum]
MAIQQGTVTITGFVGSMPVPFGRSGGVEGCSFRMGSTRRYRDGGTGEWRNLPTTWITVKAFRTLASNARMSLHVGEAAIVTGVLSTEEWTTQNDERRSRIVVEATNIGHDINYGVSELKKFQKSDRDAPAQGNGTPANPGLPPSPGGGTATAGAGQQADAHPVHPTPVTFDNLGEETPTDNPQTSQTQETSQAQEFGAGFAESPLDESTTEDMRPAGEAEF